MCLTSNQSEVQCSFGRVKIQNNRYCPISRSIFVNKEYESTDVKMLSKWLTVYRPDILYDDKVFFDIGANLGMTSLQFLEHGLATRCIAVEPDSKSFELLKHNIKLNGWSQQVTPVNAALGATDNHINLAINPTNTGDNRLLTPFSKSLVTPDWLAQPVKQLCFDTLLSNHDIRQDNIGLIWMDIQGTELSVFAQFQQHPHINFLVYTELCPSLILEAGFTLDEYVTIVENVWSSVWIVHESELVGYPIQSIRMIFESVGVKGHHTNILLVN